MLRSLIELSYESSIMATALDVAEAVASVLPPKRLERPGRGTLDDVIRKQLGQANEKSVARRTAVTDGKPPSTETARARRRTRPGCSARSATTASRGSSIDPTAVRNTEPMEKPEITDVHKLFEKHVDKDRNTEVGGPPSAPFGKVETGGSVKLPTQGGSTTKTGSNTSETTAGPTRPTALYAIAAIGGVAVVVALVIAFSGGGAKDPVVAPARDAGVVTAPDTTAALEIDSMPAGATISVDNKVVGAAPQHVVVTPKVKHHVKIALAGHVAFEDDLAVDPGKTDVVKPLLAVAPALAKIDSTPEGAQVALHDQVIGTTPIAPKVLPAELGAELVFSKVGFDTARVKVDLKAGETTEVTQPLKEQMKFGTVSFTIGGAAGWANVVIDGKAAGRTPGMKGPLSIKLVAGRHHVHLENPPSGTKRDLDVEVIADKAKTIPVAL